MAAVAERAVVPDTEAAHALEEAAQEVDAVVALRSPAAGLGSPDHLNLGPQIVRNRRVGTPGRRTSRFILAAVPPDPAVVERVHEDHPDPRRGEPGLRRELRRAHVAEGVSLEQGDGGGASVGVDLEGVRRLGQASEAEARMAARVVAVVELGGVAVVMRSDRRRLYFSARPPPRSARPSRADPTRGSGGRT